MKALYKLEVDLTYSTMRGIFIEDKEKVEWLLETKPEIYFGEVAGKHSNVSGILESEHITMITDDLKVVERLDLEHGVNPFWYPSGDFETLNDMYENNEQTN